MTVRDVVHFPANGLRLVAEAAGPADGPPVLLLHGGGQRRSSWGAALDALAARGMRAIAVDLRGHGESDWSPSGAYNFQDVAADVPPLVRAISAAAGNRPVLIIGASMGGIAGLVSTPDLGPLVAGLVLVDVVPHMRQDGADRIVEFMLSATDGFASLDEAADAVAAYLPHRTRPADNSGLLRNLRQRPDGRWVWHWDPAVVTGGSQDVRSHWATFDAAAARVTVPTMLIRGLLSDIVDEEGVAALRSVLPQVQVVDIASAAHTAATDDNDVFVSAVLEFAGAVCRS